MLDFWSYNHYRKIVKQKYPIRGYLRNMIEISG